MFGKFKITCFLFLGAWLATTRVQNSHHKNASPKLIIIGSYFSGNFDGKTQRTYKVLRAFIVNYADDTLRFWGTSCQPTEFFTVTNNNYMRLTDEVCNKSVFGQIAIPPRRSMLIPLKMLMEKQPHETVKLIVNMEFYRWFNSSHFAEDRKYHHPEILTDTITLKYNNDGNEYSAKSDWDEQEKRQKLNLPTTKLYLLSADERKHYTLNVDETKIIEAAKSEYSYLKEKVFTIPVTVHNNSNESLKYYSMSCSWDEFYHIDNKNLALVGTPCDNNIPTEVTVPAHTVHTDIIAFSCKNNSLKNPLRFRVGVNINKNVIDDLFDGYDEELRMYNIVWSNEAQLINK